MSFETTAVTNTVATGSRSAYWAGVLADLEARNEESKRENERLLAELRSVIDDLARLADDEAGDC